MFGEKNEEEGRIPGGRSQVAGCKVARKGTAEGQDQEGQ